MTLKNVKMQVQRDYVNKSYSAVLLRIFTLLMVLILFSFHAEVHALGPIAKSRQEQIAETEKKLRDLNDRWIWLQYLRTHYVEEAKDMVGRWGRGTAKILQTTLEHEEALAALDEEMEQAFRKWQLEGSVLNIPRNKSHFYRTDTYRELNQIHERKRGVLVSKYVARLNEIKRIDFEGDAAAMKKMDEEQADILVELKLLTDELDWLRSSTDAEIQAIEDQKRKDFETQDDHSCFYTNVRIRGEIRIKVGETKKIPIVIGGGVFPVKLKIRFGDGRQEYKTFNRRGFIELPFQFSKPGFKPVTLIFEDSSFPKKRSNNSVTFYVVDKDQKPMIQIAKDAFPKTIKAGDKVTYTYTVTNPGSVPLTSVAVTDDKCSPVKYSGGDSNGDNILDTNEMWTYECTTTLAVIGIIANTATVTGADPAGGQVNATTTTTVTVAASTITVPDVIGLEQATAEYDIREAGLQVGNVREQEDTQRAGVVIAQDPAGDTEIPNVPGADLTVDLTISLVSEKEVEIPTRAQLSAELDCGDSFELAPGDFAGRGCGIVVKGWRGNTDDRVQVKISYNKSSGIEVFPGDTSAPPSLMYTPGVTDYHDRYLFSESFRAKDNAQPGTTRVTITVSQAGAGSVTLTLDIAVLRKGQLPSTDPGIRPPADVTQGSGGEYCVWRFKVYGDPPKCFHFAAAKCDTPRYSQSSYELVGQGMRWGEADARVSELSRYFKDAYGCLGEPSQKTLLNVVVTASKNPVNLFETVHFTALAIYDDRSQEDITGKATWPQGKSYTPSQRRSFTMSAIYEGKTGSTTVEVLEPPTAPPGEITEAESETPPTPPDDETKDDETCGGGAVSGVGDPRAGQEGDRVIGVSGATYELRNGEWVEVAPPSSQPTVSSQDVLAMLEQRSQDREAEDGGRRDRDSTWLPYLGGGKNTHGQMLQNLQQMQQQMQQWGHDRDRGHTGTGGGPPPSRPPASGGGGVSKPPSGGSGTTPSSGSTTTTPPASGGGSVSKPPSTGGKPPAEEEFKLPAHYRGTLSIDIPGNSSSVHPVTLVLENKTVGPQNLKKYGYNLIVTYGFRVVFDKKKKAWVAEKRPAVKHYGYHRKDKSVSILILGMKGYYTNIELNGKGEYKVSGKMGNYTVKYQLNLKRGKR